MERLLQEGGFYFVIQALIDYLLEGGGVKKVRVVIRPFIVL